MSPFIIRWIKLSLVAIVGCGFLAMAIYAFVMRDEIRNAQVEPPLVAAQEEALKRRPDQPGGMEIPNRDKLVFDLLDADAMVSGAYPVQPMPEPAGGAADEVAAGAGVEEEVTPSAESAVQPVVGQAPAPVVQPVEPVAPAQPTASAPAAAPAPAAAAPKPEPKTVEAKLAETKSAGSWGVQLAAVGSKADGDKAVAKFQKDFAALKGLSPRLQATPDGKRFRVQFTGLANRAAADAVCAKMGKQACFPVAP